MHEIDYTIHGNDLQYVEVELDPNEAMVAEAGGMMYMEDGIEMETIFGDGSQQSSGFLGSLIGAGKRLLIGESLFMTVFQNRSAQKRKMAFGAPYPGKIVPIHLDEVGGELIAQKDSFLCAAKGSASESRSTRKSGPDCLAAKASSWNVFRGMAGRLSTPAEHSWPGNWPSVKPCVSTPVASLPTQKPSISTFNTSEKSNPPCLEARGSFLPHCGGPAGSGSNHCL